MSLLLHLLFGAKVEASGSKTQEEGRKAFVNLEAIGVVVRAA